MGLGYQYPTRAFRLVLIAGFLLPLPIHGIGHVLTRHLSVLSTLTVPEMLPILALVLLGNLVLFAAFSLFLRSKLKVLESTSVELTGILETLARHFPRTLPDSARQTIMNRDDREYAARSLGMIVAGAFVFAWAALMQVAIVSFASTDAQGILGLGTLLAIVTEVGIGIVFVYLFYSVGWGLSRLARKSA